MTIQQQETVAKIKTQLETAEATGTGRYHSSDYYDTDVIIFARLTRGGETRECSFRVAPDGKVATHVISTIKAG